MTRTFIIGDIHGHADRLAALLDRAGLPLDLHRTRWGPDPEPVEIVLLGDVGHYDSTTHANDFETWRLVEQLDCTVLWGNHDYANFQPALHSFQGWQPAFPEVMDIIRRMKPKFAIERHGYLLTHAGLAPRFAPSPDTPLELIAEVINACEGQPVVSDISYRRGGSATQGGILWRDAREPLADMKQVFGHSRDFEIRRFGPNRQSWCIDVADKDNGSLCGLWLPDLKIVGVGPDAAVYETSWEDSE